MQLDSESESWEIFSWFCAILSLGNFEHWDRSGPGPLRRHCMDSQSSQTGVLEEMRRKIELYVKQYKLNT